MAVKRKERDMALARALKFVPLFQEYTFEKVLALFSPWTAANEPLFNAALDEVGIKASADKAWLKHYLLHMNEPNPKAKDPINFPRYWDEATEEEAAAGTGW